MHVPLINDDGEITRPVDDGCLVFGTLLKTVLAMAATYKSSGCGVLFSPFREWVTNLPYSGLESVERWLQNPETDLEMSHINPVGMSLCFHRSGRMTHMALLPQAADNNILSFLSPKKSKKSF